MEFCDLQIKKFSEANMSKQYNFYNMGENSKIFF